MSEGPLPILHEERPPPRPDRGDASGSPLFVAFVVVSLLAVLFGGLAVASLLRDPTEPAPPRAATSTPSPSVVLSASPTPTTHVQVNGHFRFIHTAVGGGPVRWDPCRSITYAINPFGASRDVRPDLHGALHRVIAATGIHFRPVGTTRERFFHAFQRMRFGGVIRKAALILIWVDHSEYVEILRRIGDPRPSIAFAKTMQGLYADRDQYFGGLIVIDADATTTPGFGSFFAHGVVLMHELGHIMGLGHVKDPHQIMYSGRHPLLGVHRYGAGDLEGLRRLGVDAGCLD